MNPELLDFAATVFGEEATGNEKNIRMIASSILNRVDAQKGEFGYTIPEVTQNGYHAKQNANKPYQQAMTGQFKDKVSETNFKKVLQIVGGLQRGTIERDKGQFYFTDDEIKNLKTKKSFDFNQVVETGKVGKYKVFEYGTPKKEKTSPTSTKGLKENIKKSNFDKEFAKARRQGKTIFEFEGKKYTTDLK